MSSPQSAPPAPAPPAGLPTPRFARPATVNFIYIAGCVLVALYTGLGENYDRLLPFFISDFPASSADALTEVRHGEIWRLFSPAFVHFGIAHLLLNMMAMVNIGIPLEKVQGPKFFLGFTAVIALCSNLAQYFVAGSPTFGGMSGVIFGLFGFLWLRGLVDREYALRLERNGILLTLGWFAFCFTGVMHIANTAHAVGLGIGVAWGVATGLAARSRRAHAPWR